MIITNAKWLDENQTSIEAIVDGLKMIIPKTTDNRYYRELISSNTSISSYDISSLKEVKIAELSSACHNAIISGFISSALGTAHRYPTQYTDQLNLVGAVTSAQQQSANTSWSINFWCEDVSANTWSFTPHTASQIQNVLHDGIKAREAMSAQLLTLTSNVMAANTANAVNSVVWSNPI